MTQQPSKRSYQYKRSANFPEWQKSSEVHRGTITVPKHCQAALQIQHYNQFTLTTIHHNVLWSNWQKLCQCGLHTTSNTHRAEFVEIALMVDPIKGCPEINLHYPSLLPTLRCTQQCMGHPQNCITGTQTFHWENCLHFMHAPRYVSFFYAPNCINAPQKVNL